ncbi:MAG: hypothetical protein ACP5G4_04495 [bacterium]
MHIAMIASTHPPTDARVAYKEAGTLIDAGHRVSFLGLVNGEYPSHNRMEVHLLPRPKNRFLRVLKGKKLARKALEIDADAYIIHDTEVLYIAKRLAAKGKTIIHDAHEPYPDFIAEKGWVPALIKPITKRIVAKMEMTGVKNCAGIIVAMKANEERLRSAQKPILRLHNYPLMTDALAELPPKENLILYVGGLLRVRKIRELLLLSENVGTPGILESWKMKIIGPVLDLELWKSCQVEAKRFRENKNCELVDKRLPYGKIMAEIEAAKIGLSFLIPTEKYDKCISTKVFDYMAKGTIPIATWLSSYEGLITDADGPIFIPAGDEDKVPQIIADLVRDENAMRQRAETCLRSVREKFNWEADAQHLPEFIERITGKE